MSNKKKRTFRGKKPRVWIRKAAILARECLGIYNSIKRKDPISITLGGLAAYSAVEDLLDDTTEPFSVDKHLRNQGFVPVLPRLTSFVYSSLKQLAISPKSVLSGKSEIDESDNKHPVSTDETTKVETYDVEGSIFHIFFRDQSPSQLYALNEEVAVKAFSSLISQKLNKNLLLAPTSDNFMRSLHLESLSVSTEVYINSIDEENYYNEVVELQNHSRNRSAIFLGLPGSGKTTTACRIAERLNGPLLVIGPKAVSHMENYEVPIGKIVDIVEPAVILFDDLDRVEYLDYLLEDIEQLNLSKKGRKKLIIGAINDISKISSAMRRPGRFDQVIRFEPPGPEKRQLLLREYGNFFGTRLADVYIKQLVELTEDMTPAYLREIMLQSTVVPFEQLKIRVEDMKHIIDIPEASKKDDEEDDEYEKYA